jgi:hypothetical protein
LISRPSTSSRSSFRGTACPTHAVGRVALFYKCEPEFVLSDTFLFLLPGDLRAFQPWITCLQWFTPKRARLLTNLSILPHIGVSMQVNVLAREYLLRRVFRGTWEWSLWGDERLREAARKREKPQTRRPGVFLSNRNYLVILVTVPAPTVRPPSRIAKRRPSSIAIGWISSTDISVVSPGITISVPAGRVITPVTSVVRK